MSTEHERTIISLAARLTRALDRIETLSSALDTCLEAQEDHEAALNRLTRQAGLPITATLDDLAERIAELFRRATACDTEGTP